MEYIGIIGRKNLPYITFQKKVVDVVYKYNKTPLGIIVDFERESDEQFNDIKPLLDMCDGFILQGGDYYFDIDLLIVKYLYQQNKPVLGICLGMQTMAMAFNGEMGTIANHISKENYVHYVDINPDSYLYNIIKNKKIMVNSRHHDYIIKTDLKISATNDIIEAVEDATKKFFVGIQWHPESLMDDYSNLLFDNFFKHVDE